MKLLIISMLLILLIGRSRRAFFRQWRFTLPTVVTGIVTLIIVPHMMRPGNPSWLTFALCPVVAFGAGIAFKRCLDDVFGKEK
jgi:cell division protein FtsW (lipid II flippase)